MTMQEFVTPIGNARFVFSAVFGDVGFDFGSSMLYHMVQLPIYLRSLSQLRRPQASEQIK